MRIQHNIMSMNAYRNYTNNTSAMQKNLERLSSGYKINRAGDDAAGLAISEKMRAQITGLQTAQKNAKDGISLVQTAEGALTEVHDMLNRMVELATQSANGTFAGDTDRVQLQKEIVQLKEEIDRIADSANFNGIALLDGSMDSTNISRAVAGANRIISELLKDGEDAIANIGKKTILDSEGTDNTVQTKFSVDFSTLKADSIQQPESTTDPSKGTIAASEASISTAAAGTVGTATAANVNSNTPTVKWGEDDDDTTDDAAAQAKLAELIESAAGYNNVDTSTATDVKLQFTDGGGDPDKWELVVKDAANHEVRIEVYAAFDETADTNKGSLTIWDKEGGTALFTLIGNSTGDGSKTNFETAFAAANDANSGIQYTAPSGIVVGNSDSSTKIIPQYTAGKDLIAALAKAAEEEEGTTAIADALAAGGAIKLEYDKTNDEWSIYVGTTKCITVGSDTVAFDGSSLTFKDADDNELLTVKVGSALGLEQLQNITNGYGKSGGLTTTLTYNAATAADAVTINGNSAAAVSYEATEALIDALGSALSDGDFIQVEYDDTDPEAPVWKITSDGGGNAVIVSADNVKFDYEAGTLTLLDEDGETALLTISVDPGSATKEQIAAGFKGGAKKTDLVYTAPDPDAPATEETGTAKATFKLDDIEFEDVEIESDATAEDIAAAIFAKLVELDEEAEEGATAAKVMLSNGATYTVTNDGSKLTFELDDEPSTDNVSGNFAWNVSIDGGKFAGTHPGATYVEQAGSVKNLSTYANTVFKIEKSDIKDGTVIEIDGKKVTLSIGPDTKILDKDGKVYADGADIGEEGKSNIIVRLTTAEAEDLNQSLSRIVKGLGSESDNFLIGVNNDANDHTNVGIGVSTKRPNDTSVEFFDTAEKLAAKFKITVLKDAEDAGKALTLQIGDTAKSYNQLTVDISDCHVESMGIGDIDITTQDGAAEAIDAIKDAINYVSDIRGTLGATQNRLDHTINNLSVMTENITDAESTIRDTDVAEEMMAYTKNNILIQAAQAMLAQANQVPQGVLQLLQ